MHQPWVNFATYAVVALAPAATFWGAAAALDRLAGPAAAPERAGPTPASRSIEQLAADLRRLGGELAALRSSDVPAKSVRLQGLTLAYDDTLREACAALDVPLPPRPPLPPAVRLDTELALTAQGLAW